MHLEVGELITFDDDTKYFVVETLDYNDSRYVYLISESEDVNIILGKEKIEGNDVLVDNVTDEEELKAIIPLFAEKMSVLDEEENASE